MADVQLTFFVNLTDAALVKSLQAQYPDGWVHGPQPAADELGIPFKGRDMPGTAPSVTTVWHPEESSGKFLYDRAVFRIKSGAFFGLAGLFGVNTRHVWIGFFRYQPGTNPPIEGATGATVVEAIPQRRWIDGFEAPAVGGQLSGTISLSQVMTDASRVVGGMGGGQRSANIGRSHSLTDFGSVVVNTRSWERFYIRIRRLPTAPTEIWRCSSVGGTGAEGIRLYVATTGQILVNGVNNGSVETLSGISGVLTVGTWYKLDLLLSYDVVLGNSVVNYALYRNGALDAAGGPTVRSSFVGLSHASSMIDGGTANDLEVDLDDWMCAEWPRRFAAAPWGSGTSYSIGNDVTYSGVAYTAVATPVVGVPPSASNTAWARLIGPHDWMAGSHVRLLHPVAFGAGHDAAAWPGSVTVLDKTQGMIDSISGQSLLTSTTSGGVLQVQMEQIPAVARGAVAAVGAVYGNQAIAGSGTVGLGLNGAAPSMGASVPVTSSTIRWYSTMYRPLGLAAPTDFGVMRLQYTKAANANVASIIAAAVTVEYVGVFGAEDVVPDPTATPPITAAFFTFPRNPGIHNRPYPDSPWATSVTPPLAGVQILAGTYTGNGVDLKAALEQTLGAWPVHFWMARKVVPTGVSWWWSSMIAAHGLIEGSTDPQLMSRALEDPAYVSAGTENDAEERYAIRLSGFDADANVNAAVYQFIAICDPGARFLLNGAFAHGAAAADASASNALADSGFAPTFGLFFREYLQNPYVTTAAMLGKGPGSAPDGASVLNTTETASALTFGTGTITSKASMHSTTWHQVAYALMRAIEPGSTDPGVVFQITGYIGDGSASRTINLTPASGKRPLWAMVINAGGVSYLRDPSHTTTASSPVAGGATIATGLTAGGIDQISVGSTLNTNGIGYSVLVIPGSATAGNAGWSINGTFNPVGPEMPGGTQWDPAPLSAAAIDALENPPAAIEAALPGEPDLDNTTALPGTTEHCEFYSRRLVNIALSRIGVSKQVVNLNTDATEEATLARLHLKVDIEATLRDFPWPFATRYADLTLVAGTAAVPATKDWQYSYRAPTGMMFARRIVGQADQRRAYDPDPIGFREGSDAGGTLLYSDAVIDASTPVVLEYTARMSCPAYQGDPLFRTALAWRLAHSLAPALAKDTRKQAYCWVMYTEALSAAATAAANETQQPPRGDADWITGRN